MEALTTPPAWLERAVLATIPPLAREAVAGDLYETYVSPRQYAREALTTVPLVVLSQMRRNLNLPALMLQTGMAWLLLGGMATSLLIPVLMVREAYRPLSRPSAINAIRETMAVALLAMVIVQGLSFNIGMLQRLGLNRAAWFSLYLFGFMVAPLLCALRTGLIVTADRSLAALQEQTVAALANDYGGFARRISRRNLAEAGALAVMAITLLVQAAAPALAAIFALTGAWLLTQGMVETKPKQADFLSLCMLYRTELDRQQQLRRFLWWLWCSPLLFLLRDRLAGHDLAAGRPIPAMMAAAATMLLCFLVMAINREHGGRVQEQIAQIDRLKERHA